MRTRISALLAGGIIFLSSAAANAQYYNPYCNPFPLSWPFCIVGGALTAATAIVSAPFYAVRGAPYYYGYGYPYYYPSPPYYGYPYYGR
jgi:hypothetical protein